MGAGIGDEVMLVVVRLEFGSLRIGTEGKLQDRHAGKSELLAQRFDIGSDHAKIFGDDRAACPAQLFSASKSGAPGPFTHLPFIAVVSPAGIS